MRFLFASVAALLLAAGFFALSQVRTSTSRSSGTDPRSPATQQSESNDVHARKSGEVGSHSPVATPALGTKAPEVTAEDRAITNTHAPAQLDFALLLFEVKNGATETERDRSLDLLDEALQDRRTAGEVAQAVEALKFVLGFEKSEEIRDAALSIASRQFDSSAFDLFLTKLKESPGELNERKWAMLLKIAIEDYAKALGNTIPAGLEVDSASLKSMAAQRGELVVRALLSRTAEWSRHEGRRTTVENLAKRALLDSASTEDCQRAWLLLQEVRTSISSGGESR